jgi:hypothetical protein
MHEETGERDLETVAVVKPARGTLIRFLGSASARPLRVVRLRFMLPRGCSGSSTSMVRFVYFTQIIQAPIKLKGEPMITFVAMGWFF